MPTAIADANDRVFNPQELAHMQSVIDAVCAELGLSTHERARREAIAQRVMGAYRRGARLPLNMVNAGLAEHAGPGRA